MLEFKRRWTCRFRCDLSLRGHLSLGGLGGPGETEEIPIPECELPEGQNMEGIAILGTDLMFLTSSCLVAWSASTLSSSGHVAMAEAHVQRTAQSLPWRICKGCKGQQFAGMFSAGNWERVTVYRCCFLAAPVHQVRCWARGRSG